MSELSRFLFGFFGSAAVEVVLVYRFYQKNHNAIPPRYKKARFWIARGLLSIIAGFLAMAYEVENTLLAIHIGATTPLIINRFVTNPFDMQAISKN